jgi:AcrR family transcriptional regulator
MPRISKEESLARRDQIIDACEALYQQMGYRDVTMAQVAEGLSFGRANIYNYFQNKDEILLALLQREHELWACDLEGLATNAGEASNDELADGLAASLARREQMLKLMAMNLYDMEQNSRLENLADLKRAYARALEALHGLVATARPEWGLERVGEFVYALMPFTLGVYPYAHHTPKQLEAMEVAGLPRPRSTTYDLVYKLVLQLL